MLCMVTAWRWNGKVFTDQVKMHNRQCKQRIVGAQCTVLPQCLSELRALLLTILSCGVRASATRASTRRVKINQAKQHGHCDA